MVSTVSLKPYCNPAVAGGLQSVLTLCSHMGEKARQSDLGACTVFGRTKHVPGKIILNSRLQLLGAN